MELENKAVKWYTFILITMKTYRVNLPYTCRNCAMVAPSLSPTASYVPRGGISSLITSNLSYAFLHNHGLSLTLCEATVISVNGSIANLHLPQVLERLGLGEGITAARVSERIRLVDLICPSPGEEGKGGRLWRDNKWRGSISDRSPHWSRLVHYARFVYPSICPTPVIPY